MDENTSDLILNTVMTLMLFGSYIVGVHCIYKLSIYEECLKHSQPNCEQLVK